MINKRGEFARFKSGHNNRGKRGSDSHKWKGGFTNSLGYIQIKSHNHPFKNSDSYVMQHRLIYEHYLSIIFDEDVFIPKEYDVHHIKPVKEGGTNALMNLELVTKSEHQIIHRSVDYFNRTCLVCNSKPMKKNIWCKYKDGFICNKCYMREYYRNHQGL